MKLFLSCIRFYVQEGFCFSIIIATSVILQPTINNRGLNCVQSDLTRRRFSGTKLAFPSVLWWRIAQLFCLLVEAEWSLVERRWRSEKFLAHVCVCLENI